MKYLNSEHISFLAALLQPRFGKSRDAVAEAIKIQLEAEKQCLAINRERELDEARGHS